MIEGVPAYASHEDVLKAVVIVIADGYTNVETLAHHVGSFRHVCKSAIAVVTKEAIRVLRTFFHQAGHPRAVHDEDIQHTIVVVIEDGDSSAHRLRQVLTRSAPRASNELRRRLVLKANRIYPACRRCQKAQGPSLDQS